MPAFSSSLCLSWEVEDPCLVSTTLEGLILSENRHRQLAEDVYMVLIIPAYSLRRTVWAAPWRSIQRVADGGTRQHLRNPDSCCYIHVDSINWVLDFCKNRAKNNHLHNILTAVSLRTEPVCTETQHSIKVNRVAESEELLWVPEVKTGWIISTKDEQLC